jgi:hypothetical protein
MFTKEELDKDSPIILPEGAEDISIHRLDYRTPFYKHPQEMFIGDEPEQKCSRCDKPINFHRGEVYTIGREGRRADGAPVYTCKDHAPKHHLYGEENKVWFVEEPEKFYDNGSGMLWHCRIPLMTEGYIRADSWEEAHEIWEDEIAPRWKEGEDPDPYDEEKEDREWKRNNPVLCKKYEHACACWNEAYGYSPNNGVYCKDLNGNSLDPLTIRHLAETYTWGMVIRFRIPAEKDGELSYPIEMRFTTLDWV